MAARTKPKTVEKPAAPRKAAIAKLVQPPQADIDDDADDRQRVGVQSLGRAFAILEEVARHRDGIGLAEPQQAGRPAQFHHVPSGQDHGVAGLSAPGERFQALPHRPAAVRAGGQRARRNRDGECRHPGARGPVAGNQRKWPFCSANGRRRGGDRPHQRPRRVSIDRPRRRGAAGALHRARQDHSGLAASRTVEAVSRTRRAEAIDREVDHRHCRR